jgi:hypothetical protein
MMPRQPLKPLLLSIMLLAVVGCSCRPALAGRAGKRHLLQAADVPAADVCRNAYNAAGGLQGLSTNAPSCASQASFNLQNCCSEVRIMHEWS